MPAPSFHTLAVFGAAQAAAALVALNACSEADRSPGVGVGAAGGASSASAGRSGAEAAGSNGAAASSSGAGASGGSTSGEVGTAPCGAFVPGDALSVCVATYLGGTKNDAIGGVDIAKDGGVLVGMTLPDENLGATPSVFAGASSGAIVKLDAIGKKVLAVARLGSAVAAISVDPTTGNIAACGDFGVALVEPTTLAPSWIKPTPGGACKHVSARGGLVGASAGTKATLFASDGAEIATVDVTAKEVNGVAVDAANEALVVTGYRQDDGDKCQQYKSSFVRSYAVDGSVRWKSYDWSKAEVGASGDCADTVGLGLAVGRDGKLYYVGKSDGGNTVHAKHPRDLSQKAPVVAFDAFNQAYGFKGASSIGFYGRFSLGEGALEAGQFVVARKGDGGPNAEGNAATPTAIAADEAGHVFVSGTAAFRIAGQDTKTVAGQKVGAYASYEGFLLIVSPDFSKRLSWTSFSAGGASDGRAIAAAGGTAVYAAAVSAEQAAKGSMITSAALASAPIGGDDGYLVVLPSP